MRVSVSLESSIGESTPLPDNSRVRFSFDGLKHIDVGFDAKHGFLVVHADGFSGSLEIQPRVSNEIWVRLAKS